MVKDKSFYKQLFRLSLPAAFQSAISLLVVMADNVMVTRTGANALSAVSQSNTLTTFVTAMLGGLATGSVVLISQYWGKKDLKRIRTVCAVALSVCLLALSYLPIVCLSYIPQAATAAMVAMLKGVEVVKVTLYTTLLSLVSNIGLNYVLIFGKLGVPALGITGAAIATVIARVLECALVSVYLFRMQKALPLRIRDLTHHEKWAWQDYARFGLPVGLTDAQWALVGLCKAAVIGQMGKQMIDAAAVTDMMMNLGTMFTFSLAGGACVMVGKAVGAKDYRRVREYSNTIQLLFLFFGVIMSSLVFLLRKPFASLYQLDAPTFALAAQMIGICAFTLLGTTYHASCFMGINRGAGDSKFVMLVDVFCGWLVVIPAAFIGAFVLHLPLWAVYLCTRIDQFFKWIIAFVRLRGDKWIKNVTRETA